ncbi:MAG: PepSY domain-containing protein [Alphaproteobacteria bacterium]|nr:PepSY domain-containing protein [Alphaproteobacteria bacterium]MBU1524991.1 PepSY domain-containing protein [Alphaproteobacteria bacterium]MBU2117822.1 PepSY domain-containing protein [Alphaproteobacteria bacterium]MBU2349864.1 PepSY domain-containing protein [Alphaproteobacteria bacterium]MBU2382479.1 PepSY domain-containing protein [Alphaproteobacteria bacterium]
MIRLSALIAAALLTAAPGAVQARAASPEVAHVQAQDPQAAIRTVERGRPGRRVGVRVEGQNVVVVWEYPGGRVVEIVVDGRTGRILGERG